MSDDRFWAARFPDLFAESYVDYADAHVRLTLQVPPEPLVSRLHLIAVTDEGNVVVCRSDRGWRFLPGGTREPGETIQDLARRELLEESGAELLDAPAHFASFTADLHGPAPDRPHLPHPRAHWAFSTARVRIAGAPTCPPDGEQVIEVLTLPAADAADYLRPRAPEHADLVLLAQAQGRIGPAT